MKRFMSLVVACILIAMAVYIMVYIPTIVDFNNVIVRLEDNDTIYRFLIYLPLIICIFNGLLALINVFTDNITISFINLALCIGIIIYIALNIMGSNNAIPEIGARLTNLEFVNVFGAVLMVVNIVVHFMNKFKKKKALPEAPAENAS